MPDESKLRVVFMGTPELACASLRALLAAPDLRVVAAVTQPDRARGRHLKLQPSPVKSLALANGIPVLQPQRARDEAFIGEMAGLKADLVAVAAFGQLLPKAILDLPRFGCINVHTSLLPRYRGAAPIQWAILNDDPETGVTIMKMDAGLDTGDILAMERTPIAPDDTSETLHDRLAELGAGLLVRTIRDYTAGRITVRPQPVEGIVLAPRIRKQDGQIEWRQPARRIRNQVRGLRPWPGAFTFTQDLVGAEKGTVQPGVPKATGGSPAAILKIWKAGVAEGSGPPGEIIAVDKTGIVVACGQDALRLTELQREGGRRLDARQYLSGHSLRAGQRLG